MRCRFRVNFEVWHGALVAALGVAAMASCSGKSVHTGSEQAGGSGGNGGSGTGGAGGTGSANRFPCGRPTPLLDGFATGFVRCDDDSIRREAAMECPSLLPREPAPDYEPSFDSCSRDEECTSAPNGHCSRYPAFPGPLTCQYGCLSDSDCGPDQVCECGIPVGKCVSASCLEDAECEPGFHCATADSTAGCGNLVYACQTPSDECSMTCASGRCMLNENEERVCVQQSCEVGRPFLIEGAARTAERRRDSTWSARCEPMGSSLSAATRAELAEHWTSAGLAEHASIAAFARFGLELLALGAPPELLELTAAAMRDEIEHARVCFGLAAAYGGVPVGPGALAMAGALPARVTLENAVLSTLAEGCVGETLAALEAAESAAHASDPAVAGVLERIAADESRHAELAFRFVHWAMRAASRELRVRVQRELETIRIELVRALARRDGTAPDGDSSEHGVLPASHRAALRLRAFDEVVAPAVALLLRAPEPAGHTRAMSATSSA